jgi:cytochrome P450
MKEYLKLYGRSSKRRSLLTKIIAGDEKNGTEPLSDPEISVEVSNLVFAATDTTGNTMTYALYELSNHPEWQEKLRAELKEAKAKEGEFAFQQLSTLPVLNGIHMETLRLHPAVPSGLPRMTTEAGRIAGVEVAPKVSIAILQSLRLFRNR